MCKNEFYLCLIFILMLHSLNISHSLVAVAVAVAVAVTVVIGIRIGVDFAATDFVRDSLRYIHPINPVIWDDDERKTPSQ